MNKKEIAEIKKQLAPDKNAISRIAGCYVSAEKEKIITFSESFGMLPEEELFKYYEIFRKALSGSIGKNMLDMEFPDEAEEEGGTQSSLLELCNSRLEDDDLLEEFYDKIIDSYVTGENYLILLIHNSYDVPGRGKDRVELFDASEEVYDYIQAVICPVDLAKPALSYHSDTQSFRNRERDWIVGMPQIGFLFPAFNDRRTDIHGVLYYSKNAEELHFDFTDRLLGCQLPLSAGLQKEAFQVLIEETLGENCSFDTVKNIHDQLQEITQQAKDSPDPVTLDRITVRNLLEESGAGAAEMEDFDTKFEENAGEKGSFLAANVVGRGRFEVHTPDVTITVSPDRSDLVETKIIDGRECLVIPITDEVQVNGIRIRHARPNPDPARTSAGRFCRDSGSRIKRQNRCRYNAGIFLSFEDYIQSSAQLNLIKLF